ncbi:MAG: flagellar basal body-associated FliL family protein [Geminicoccaceae bacterium]
MAEETTGEVEAEGKPKSGKKKLLLFGGIGLVLLLGAAGGAAWFLGLLGGHASTDMAAGEHEAHAVADDGHGGDGHGGDGHGDEAAGVVFVDMPDVLVNLQSGGQRIRFLKLRAALEVASEDVATRVKGLMPRIMDSFQLYLRALTVDEVSGSGGLQRLKEELATRVNFAVQPNRVDDVLVKEMLVQ